MQIGDWLRSLGLAQYEPAFRENDIDAGVLPELEGFEPTPEMPEIAEAHSLLAALAPDRASLG